MNARCHECGAAEPNWRVEYAATDSQAAEIMKLRAEIERLKRVYTLDEIEAERAFMGRHELAQL